MIRVLLAEDSAAAREQLGQLLGREPAIELVGAAVDGEEAVTMAAELRPDVILMDVRMPRLDGYEAARMIMRSSPAPIVMISGDPGALGADGGFRALEAGALMLLEKPPGGDGEASARAARELARSLRLMAEVKVVRRWAPGAGAPAPPAVERRKRVEAIAIGASTGGPPVVAALLAQLPADLPCPVLLVQHIAPAFTAGFAEWLGRSSGLEVTIARAGERLRPGTVYVAGGGAHTGVGPGRRIALERPTAGSLSPSVSHLFHSVAAACGAAGVGVLLTGMGRDGADGLLAIRRAGGVTIAQDAASSVVFGMPGEAVRLGAATHVLPPERIASTLAALTGTGRLVRT